jgi:Transposase
MGWMAPSRQLCAKMVVVADHQQREPSMGEITIGVDIAKHVFQLHGVDAAGKVVVCRRLRRGQVATFFAALPPCRVGMEACATAHFWAREIAAFGHDVRLMPPCYVKPYVKRNKHDAADAEAVCEAVRRPSMRFVPVKTPQQQAALVAHSVRDLLVRQRTMLVNAVRGHLAEFGIVAPRGLNKVKDRVAVVADENDGRPTSARGALRLLAAELAAIDRLRSRKPTMVAAGGAGQQDCTLRVGRPAARRGLSAGGIVPAARACRRARRRQDHAAFGGGLSASLDPGWARRRRCGWSGRRNGLSGEPRNLCLRGQNAQMDVTDSRATRRNEPNLECLKGRRSRQTDQASRRGVHRGQRPSRRVNRPDT